ncbi:hypothetical protein KC345_g125 [Hortaea werneckii]|nr:hypothetical protein KC345_g125 [Hortaea werneckii]
MKPRRALALTFWQLQIDGIHRLYVLLLRNARSLTNLNICVFSEFCSLRSTALQRCRQENTHKAHRQVFRRPKNEWSLLIHAHSRTWAILQQSFATSIPTPKRAGVVTRGVHLMCSLATGNQSRW